MMKSRKMFYPQFCLNKRKALRMTLTFVEKTEVFDTNASDDNRNYDSCSVTEFFEDFLRYFLQFYSFLNKFEIVKIVTLIFNFILHCIFKKSNAKKQTNSKHTFYLKMYKYYFFRKNCYSLYRIRSGTKSFLPAYILFITSSNDSTLEFAYRNKKKESYYLLVIECLQNKKLETQLTEL